MRLMLADLQRSEARCPGCAKARRVAEEQALREHLEPGEMKNPEVCNDHQEFRYRLATKNNGWK